MANFESQELPRAAIKDPHSRLALPPGCTHTWMTEKADHLAAQTQRCNYGKRLAKAHPPIGPIVQGFLLYQMRFVLEADHCSAWTGIGGLGAQNAHTSIVLNIAVAETIRLALTYRNILSFRMAGKTRQRSTIVAEIAHMLPAGKFGFREQAKRDVSDTKPPPLK